MSLKVGCQAPLISGMAGAFTATCGSQGYNQALLRGELKSPAVKQFPIVLKVLMPIVNRHEANAKDHLKLEAPVPPVSPNSVRLDERIRRTYIVR